ncbi:hypothetical protein NPIL_302311 [Nephila pilipes]|uniref:Uncharacterized protein n=1 Tax=Nephila pilipes TaxID=299642 RepID=A0A8X6U8I6_NEPPI|nr:hypothetical protein NPIL_302311 [Nephila pilipes]
MEQFDTVRVRRVECFQSRELPVDSDDKCLGDMLVLAILVYRLLEFPLRYNLSGHYSVDLQGNFSDDDFPIISSVSALTTCQAVGMKENFAPDRDEIDSNSLKPPKINVVPIVQSEVVYHFCQALNLRARLAPLESRVDFNPPKRFLKKQVTPIVHSEMVYSICLALNLKAELVALK